MVLIAVLAYSLAGNITKAIPVLGALALGAHRLLPAMQQTYNAFKWTKIQQQDLYELAIGFDNEVAPTVLEASGKVFRLNGTLDTQYSEWRDILREIFALETGLRTQ